LVPNYFFESNNVAIANKVLESGNELVRTVLTDFLCTILILSFN